MRKFYAASLLVLAACSEMVAPAPPATKPTTPVAGDLLTISTTLSQPAANCDQSSTLSLAVGEVRPLSEAQMATLCVAGGTGSDYALIPVFTRGAPPVGGNTLSSGSSIPVTTASASYFLGGAAAPTRDVAFDAHLRSAERALFASQAPAARASYDRAASARSSGGARFSVATAVPVVGDLVTFNTEAEKACTNAKPRTGRVVAVTRNSIVVADTGNPTGGFTTAEYQSFGAAFDTLVYPLDTLNFGKPGDVDGNGDRAVIFYTKAVNDLTPEKSDTYVGGFFFGRDLYPKTTSGNLQGCASSNYAEIFYMLVPDPARAAGKTNSPFTKQSVSDFTVSVLAHEFQHLINDSRRLYVTRTNTTEETWLNEGLSHVAEELTFYRAAGLPPRSNIDATTLNTAGRTTAFNRFESSNIGRLLEYLRNTERNSPIADNDSIATRGATWQLLRYSADRKGGDERDTWRALVNTNTSGLQNLVNVFGTAAFGGARPWLRDWAVTNYTDDAGYPVAAAYQSPSWNLRSFIPALRGSPPYPLVTRALTAASPVTVSLVGGGGSAYLPFSVSAGATTRVVTAGTVALPNTLDMVLVRTR